MAICAGRRLAAQAVLAGLGLILLSAALAAAPAAAGQLRFEPLGGGPPAFDPAFETVIIEGPSLTEAAIETIILSGRGLTDPAIEAGIIGGRGLTDPAIGVVAATAALAQGAGAGARGTGVSTRGVPGQGVGALLIAQLPVSAEGIEARNRAFRERVARAVERHPALAGADNRRAEDAEGVKEAKSALYPQISMGLSGGRSMADPSGSYSSSAHGRTDLVLRGRQLIYDFGATFGRIDAARFEERATGFDVLITAKQTTLDALGAYLRVITLRDQVALAEKNVAKHQDIASMVVVRIEAKVAPASDTDQINSRLATAESMLSAYIGDLARAEAVFTELFDEDAGPVLFPVVDLALLPNNDETLSAAVAAHPRMKMHDMQVWAAKRMSDAAWSDKLPRLMLEADVTRYDIDPTFDSSGGDDGDPYGAVVRLNVIYDLFDGGSGRARENKAKFRAAKVQNDRDVFRRELNRQIRYAYADVVSNEGSIKALKLSVRANKGTVYAYDQKYRIGRVSLIDLLDAQADLYQAALNFTGGRLDLLLAKFSVLMLTGGLLNYFDVDTAKFLDVSMPEPPAIHEIFTGGLLEYFSIDVTEFLDVGAPDAPDANE